MFIEPLESMDYMNMRGSMFKGTEYPCICYPDLKIKDGACFLGFAANSGSIAALCSAGGVAVFSDELNHASLVDGIRMGTRSGCSLSIYRHCDYKHLDCLLAACKPGQRKLVITDGVFSMDGDIADLQVPTQSQS